MHPLYVDPGTRSELYRLLGSTWPRLPGLLAAAARLGWRWDEVTTPFVARAGGRIVSHVGVLDLPVVLGGRERRVAGLHAVCTDPAFRRRGHYRAAMEEALRIVDAGPWSAAKLTTSQPELYEGFGFRVVPQHRFRVARRGPAGRARAVGEADLARVHDLLARRAPASRLFAARDPGWLLGLDEVIESGGLGRMRLLDDPELLLVSEVVDGVLRVHEVVAPKVPPLEAVLAAAPAPFEAVELWTSADLLAPGAEPLPWPPGDFLMVRGDWPDLPPFAVGVLASH
jgi:predicted N-acetyltransferase YhbS